MGCVFVNLGMKKLLILLLLPVFGYGQWIDGKPLSELDAPYIEIESTLRAFSVSKFDVNINYGQVSKDAEIRKTTVYRDSTEKRRFKFNGHMDLVNRLNSIGYEVETIYLANFGQTGDKRYILMKKVK